MNHTKRGLQIYIHKVDGETTTFVQDDVDEVKRILASFEPARLFDQDRFVISDGDSMTSVPVSKITRIDLFSDLLPHLLFPAGIMNAVELTAPEYETLVRNPIMRKQWEQMRVAKGCLITILDLEMADGQRVLLTIELQVEQQTEAVWNGNWLPMKGSSLCFRMRSGGVAVLNPANLVRLTFFPKPEHLLPDAWQARQCATLPQNQLGCNPQP